MSAYIALTGSAEQEQVEGFNPLAKWKGQGTVRPHPLTEILKAPPVRTQQDHQEKGEPMSSISVNGKGRPKATIQATQGEPSVPPPMISLPVGGRNGLLVWKVELGAKRNYGRLGERLGRCDDLYRNRSNGLGLIQVLPNGNRTNAVAAALTTLLRHHWLGEKPLYQIAVTKSHAGNKFGQNPYVDASLL